MFKLICKNSHHVGRSGPGASLARTLYFLQTQPISSSPKSIKNSPNQRSFAVTYLINSCGFSPEKALSASKYVKFKAPDKPDSVLAFFKNHGFTQTQISNIIAKFPGVILCDPEKTLLPKLDFFKSKGLSSTDVAKTVGAYPFVLKRSLENTLIPSFNFYSNLIQSEEKTLAHMKRSTRLLLSDRTQVTSNIEILREAGVPESNIMYLFKNQPRAFVVSTYWFRKVVDEVKEMGFDPSYITFVLAFHALRSMTKSTWRKKVEVYKKWGLSDDEICAAFKKQPWCMTASEDKIKRVMDFLVNKIGLESSVVARWPIVISLSLERRIVPRYAVYQVLLVNGLINTNVVSLITLLKTSEKLFLKKLVKYHKEEGPEILKLYKEKLNLAKQAGQRLKDGSRLARMPPLAPT